MRKLLSILVFLFFVSTANAQLWSGVLNSSRAIDWTQAGIPGGIPSGSWTQCGATIAAYTGTAATINNALAHTGVGYTGCTANQYVLLGPGTFNLSTSIFMSGLNRVALRGSGANATFITFSAPATNSVLANSTYIGATSTDQTYARGNQAGQTPVVRNWTAGYANGATSITLSDGSGIVAGKTTIVLDQCNTGLTTTACTGTPADNGNLFMCDTSGVLCGATNGPNTQARFFRGQVEYVEAVSCSPACGTAGPTVITITPPLQHPNWSAGQSPQAWLIQPVQYVGLENFSVDGGSNTPAAMIGFFSVSYGWVSGVKISNGWQAGIFSASSNHMQFESNYIYNTGRSLAMSDPYNIRYFGANYLIQNNILQKNKAQLTMEGAAPGSVIGYNYFINNYYNSDAMGNSIEPHSMGNDLILSEGNIAPGYMGESLHGSAQLNTTFRNFFTGFESCGNGQCGAQTFKDSTTNAVLFAQNARYNASVGNVLGTVGNLSGYITNSSYPYIYRLGNNFDNALVKGTGLFYGNWDAFTNATRWCKDASSTNWAVAGNCNSVSEIPTAAAVYPVNLADVTLGDTGAGQGALPASFYLSGRPSWYPVSVPFPAIGPDVTLGTVGQCTGVKNTVGQFALLPATASAQCAPTTGFSFTASAWGGHVNANPAMLCYLSMGGNPDGTNGGTAGFAFDPTTCYAAATAPAVNLTWSGGAFPMAFGGHVQGVASGTLVGTLTNTGTGTLTYTLISVTGTNSADFVVSAGSCVLAGSTLAPGASCTFNVIFTPSVCGGGYPCAKTANLRVDSNASSTPDLGVLTGTSTAAPVGNGTPSTPTLTGMLWTNDKYAFYHCTPYPCATACYSCSLPFGVKRPVITFK